MKHKWTKISDAINLAIDELLINGTESHACAVAEDRLTEALFWVTYAEREDLDNEPR